MQRETKLEQDQNQVTVKKWRWGINRWWVLLFILLSIITSIIYPPVQPHIQIAAEHLSAEPILSTPLLGEIYFTNTMVAMLIVDLLLAGIVFAVNRAGKSGKLVPSGIPGALEAMMEVIYNLTESTAGKWARTIFPFFAIITLTVLITNWMELIPGVDNIGILHPAEDGHPISEIAPGIWTVVPGEPQGQGYKIIPFIRVTSTDLNFTIALALVSVIMTQVIGVRAVGMGYFKKYWNTSTFFKKPVFGLIDFAVGLLELISEFAKILSFSFRLFGNIFAGTVMLFIIGTLIPVVAQSAFLGLEFFVGLIQAIVFGMLTMVFMAMATQSHGSHDEEEH